MARKDEVISDHGHCHAGRYRSDAVAAAAKRDRRSLVIAVSTRRQTPEEERHFRTVFRVFLAEMVRQQLEREGLR